MADVTDIAARDDAVSRWTRRLAGYTLPVCAGTVRQLSDLSKRSDSITARQLAAVVQRDPLFALRVLRHLGKHRGRRQTAEITTVEHGIMMLGIGPFFSAFRELDTVERLLGARPRALAGFGRVLARSRLAARFSRLWAQLRLDVEADEIVSAALLYDLAELLLWCFDSDAAENVAERMRAAPGMRSSDAQRQVLGFRLQDLQLDLAREWALPGLLVDLMDDTRACVPRVRSVALSVALARHALNGWQDPALADDYREAAELLHMPESDIRRRARAVTMEVLSEQESAELHERALAFPGDAEGIAGEMEIIRDLAAWRRAAAAPGGTRFARRAAMLEFAATVFSALFGTGLVRRAAYLGVVSGGTEARYYERDRVPFTVPLAQVEAQALLDLGQQPPAWVLCEEDDPRLPLAIRRLFEGPAPVLLPVGMTVDGESGVFVVAAASVESGALSHLPAWIAAGAAHDLDG